MTKESKFVSKFTKRLRSNYSHEKRSEVAKKLEILIKLKEQELSLMTPYVSKSFNNNKIRRALEHKTFIFRLEKFRSTLSRLS